MKSCSILISSWCGHKAIELCIESILKRTNYKAYQIIVCDSSSPYGPDRKYLRNHKEKGNIELLESHVRLQHGEALWRLLSYCKTDLACIFDSDNEVLSSDWLEKFTSQIQDHEKDLGVGFLLKGDNRPNNDFFFTPLFHPSYLVLNMPLYRQIAKEDDWMCAIHAMPIDFFSDKVRHYGGMSAYHTRLDHPHVSRKYELLIERLQILRGQNK